MSRAIVEVLQSLFYASLRGRILLGILCAYFAIALPTILPFGSAFRARANHHAPAPLLFEELDYTFWFDARNDIAAVEPALLASAFVSFLLGIFFSGGWLEVLSKREGKPGLKVFCSGGGARFFRFLRLAVFSLAAVACARFVFYGYPAKYLLSWITGADEPELISFHSENSSRLFVNLQSAFFTISLAAIVLVSDLARASIVVRGGRSAFLGAIHGISLFVRKPLPAIAAAGLPFLLEMGLLVCISWGVERTSSGEPTILNLILLFILITAVGLVREIARAGRLGGLLAIANVDAEARLERRYGSFADPVIAAAGRAMTTDDEG